MIRKMTIMAIAAGALLASREAVRGESLILDEITVRGEKEPPREENLSIREVRESPARDVGEALKQLEGISIVRKGAIANDVVLRGLQRDNINVLVDGVRLHGACPSRMDPPSFHVDFAEVDQIRVVKGPYDSENPGSMGGLVDIRTKGIGKGLGSDVNLTYGSYNSLNASGTLSYGTDKVGGLVGYAHKRSDVPESGNGRLITDIYPSTSANRYRADAVDSRAYEINTGWTKITLTPTDNSRSELSYSYQDADHVLYPYLKMDADYDRTHRLNWNYRLEKVSPLVSEVRLQAYWDRVSHLMDDSLRVSSTPSITITRPYSMQTDARTQVVGAKMAATLSFGPGSLKTGLDYYNRNWNAENRRAMYTMGQPYTLLNMVPDVYVDNLGMFGAYDLPLGETVTLKGGLRGDLTWVEANKGNPLVAAGTGTDFDEVSGNLQLTWRPVTGLELFAGLGRGVRTPDPEELYIDVPATAPAVTWSGNPGLKPTINHQADLGAKYAASRYYINLSIFYSDIKNYVNLSQTSATLKNYQNIDARLWGAELGSQVSLPYDLFLRGALTYTEGKNKDGNRPLSEIPPLKGLIAVRYDNGIYFFEVAENLARQQDRVDMSLNEQPTPGWATTDLKAGMNYHGWSFYSGIYNLFDRQYYSHLSYLRDPFASGVGVKVPENGRNFYLTAQYSF